MSDDGAEVLSAEDKAYFGEEAVAEATATPAADAATPETQAETTDKPADKPAETKPADKPEDGERQKTVPLAALHEERARRKELQDEIAQQRERTARMEERFQQFMQRAQQPPEQPPPVDQDPVAAVRRHEQFIAQQQQAAHQQAAQQQVLGELSNFVGEHEARFRQTTPDYEAALAHLTASRSEEYRLSGVPAAQIQQFITRDAYALSAQARQLGRNPAEMAYELAKLRGYAPKAAEAETKPATPAVTGEEKMAMLERGTQAAKSLSTGGGGNAELTLESLANMDDDEFAALPASTWRKLWRDT